jgi:hypothetical protein
MPAETVRDIHADVAPACMPTDRQVSQPALPYHRCLLVLMQVSEFALQGNVSVTRSGSTESRARGTLRPAPAEVAASACDCEAGELASGDVSLASSSSGTAAFSVAEDLSSSSSSSGSENAAVEGGKASSDSSCTQTAWVLPLAAGQNEFALTLPALVEPPAVVSAWKIPGLTAHISFSCRAPPLHLRFT